MLTYGNIKKKLTGQEEHIRELRQTRKGKVQGDGQETTESGFNAHTGSINQKGHGKNLKSEAEFDYRRHRRRRGFPERDKECMELRKGWRTNNRDICWLPFYDLKSKRKKKYLL